MLRVLKRKILLALFSLLLLTASVYLAPKVYIYYQASQFEHQGDILLAQSKYQEALGKYKESRNKWNDVEINEKITRAQNLVESDESYKTGLKAFNNKEHDKAIEAFLNVKSIYVGYDKARNLLEEVKERLKKSEKAEQIEKQVKGSQTQINKQLTPQNQSPPAPTEIIITTPAPDFQQIESLCKNKIQSWMAKQEVSLRNAVYDSPKKLRKIDPICSSVAERMMPRLLENIKSLIEGVRANLMIECVKRNGDFSVISDTDLDLETEFINAIMRACGN